MAQRKKLPAAFYCMKSGREPVREWLRQLDKDDRRVVGEDKPDLDLAIKRKKDVLS